MAAVLYALHIVGLGAWSNARDALGMSIVQILVIAAVCLLATAPDGRAGAARHRRRLAVGGVHGGLPRSAGAAGPDLGAGPPGAHPDGDHHEHGAGLRGVLRGAARRRVRRPPDARRRRPGADRDAASSSSSPAAGSRPRSSTSPSDAPRTAASLAGTVAAWARSGARGKLGSAHRVPNDARSCGAPRAPPRRARRPHRPRVHRDHAARRARRPPGLLGAGRRLAPGQRLRADGAAHPAAARCWTARPAPCGGCSPPR